MVEPRFNIYKCIISVAYIQRHHNVAEIAQE